MKNVLSIPVDTIVPTTRAILREMGLPPKATVPPHYQPMLDSVLSSFLSTSRPVAVYDEISCADFQAVYAGEGNNAADTPLEHIFPNASRLFLFALTLGEKISEEIERRFDNNEAALGYILDVVASLAAENAVQWVGSQLHGELPPQVRSTVLAYSPGYCGWHISGQKKLFQVLVPEETGVVLTPSYLMRPLKSVSGVFVVGEGSIHRFFNTFPFCEQCAGQNCKARIASVQKGSDASNPAQPSHP